VGIEECRTFQCCTGRCIWKGILLLPCCVTCAAGLCLCRHHSFAHHIKTARG